MKSLLVLLNVFFFAGITYGQNNWKSYNNQPVKQMVNVQTDKKGEPNNNFKQVVDYYPNGYIKTVETSYGNKLDVTKHYIYENDELISIFEKQMSFTQEKPIYNIELVEETKNKYLPLKSEKLEIYDVTSEVAEGDKSTITYTYDQNDRLKSSFQLYQLTDNLSKGLIKKVKYDNKNFIAKTFLKDYDYVKDENDTTFNTIENDKYKTLDRNKIGVTEYQVKTKEDKDYYHISYSMYKEGNVNSDFEYLKIEDIYDFYLDDIIRKDNISDYTYQVIKNRVLDTTYTKSLITEDALQSEDWYVNKFYKDYITQELENNRLDNYISSTQDALVCADFFEKDELEELRMSAYQNCVEHKNYLAAEEFIKPLYDEAKIAYRSNPSEKNGKILGLTAKVFYLQNKNADGDHIMQECESYKSSLRGQASESMKDKIEYYKFNYFLAQVYAAKNDMNTTKKLLEENISYYDSLEDTYKESETFSTDYAKNKKMLVTLNTPSLQ
ncbi:hypothetical protein [Mesonia mobilis]|uniref:YD repeat-containing protein n=1 Tax=Mesonia mobilis TaxID=369791 RepID=A0ABQ3BGQ0_9FLAO|nr:hypothetical protein [Mesonia mobilis]MBQ0738695.1 hypothetical protein [Aquimarina celericrescens]GGZ44346.1 hypothetical protein GCM10008088_01680 [Mesonia mobilis]